MIKRNNIRHYIGAGALLALLPCSALADAGFSYSGYARVVAGYSDESAARYEGYSNQVSLDEHTLLGLQGELQLSDQLSITGQALAHSGEFQSSGLEWLYLSYRPTKNLDIKLGQMRTPFFDYSDVLDIGFGYHWVLAPREMYNDFVFKNFQGVDVRYQWVGKQFTTRIEGYFGSIEEDTQFQGTTVRTEVDDLKGLIAEVSWNGWQARASYHQSRVNLQIPELDALSQVLRGVGFERSAESLSTEEVARFTQASLAYESLSYFVRSEFSRIYLPFDFAPDIESFYLTSGIYVGDVTYHITFAKRIDRKEAPQTEIPFGVAPELDTLAFAYNQVFDNIPDDDVRSVTVGARWDIKHNMALKFELKRVLGEKGTPSSFTDLQPGEFDAKATVALAAVEVVF